MSKQYCTDDVLKAITYAGSVLAARKEEVNKLNVFPVPDGDTGTNMSLTLQSVVDNIAKLPENPTASEAAKAVTTGALMGARGNSGVITSQIFRGLCEGCSKDDILTTDSLDEAFDRAVEVAFQAVRKPIEGTILTVLRDSRNAARKAKKKKLDVDEALAFVADEAFASVQRTPDLLPVLKENGVVDAGGYGLAIIFGAIASSLVGTEVADEVANSLNEDDASQVKIEQINDWEGSRFRYCNEFLVDSDILSIDDALEFLAGMGDCELCVGATPKFKVHVHSNHPDQVLAYFLERGQISEVFIHNMQLQSAERTAKLAADQDDTAVGTINQVASEKKPFGFVAVASGEGSAAILKELGVDVVVSGGQTMNPSTKDLFDAAQSINAEAIIILPNNGNIIMAAQAAASLSEVPCAVVPTKSVLESFTALSMVELESSLEDVVEEMTEVAQEIHTGEITYAVKDSRDVHGNPIESGDVIGIADGSLEAVGSSLEDVTLRLLEIMDADDADLCTILAGAGFDDEALAALTERIEESFEDLDISVYRGEQPLYPILFSLE